MRILVDFQDTVGGAPRSLKEHALLLQENGHEIVAVISEKNYDSFFLNTGFEVSYIPRFSTRNISKNISSMFKYQKLIKQKKIDLIYTNRVVQSQFLSIVSDFSKTPILNGRAGGYITNDILKIQKDKHYIVYSDENLQALKKIGFKGKMVFLLRNRIPMPILHNIKEKEFDNKVHIVVTGNVKEDTLKGLLWLFKFISGHTGKVGITYHLNLAGSIILKSKEDRIKYEQALLDLEETLPSNWEVNQLGWVNNINEVQEKSHICIGKGRSIIQPAMIGKITFVISEKGKLYRCKKDNYKDLQYFNFSGRGEIFEQKSSISEFNQVLNDPTCFLRYQNEAKEISTRFQQDYDSTYAKDYLEKIVGSVTRMQKIEYGAFKALRKYIYIYIHSIKNLMINKRKNGKW